MENIFLILNIAIVLILLLAIIFTAGIVWRVEEELDISYKFFLLAVLFIFASQVIDLTSFWIVDFSASFLVKMLSLLFAASFLTGILFMRDIVRKIDGEKRK